MIKNSSKRLNKQPTNPSFRLNLTNTNSFTNKNYANRLKPIQFQSPKRQSPRLKNSDFYSYQRSMVASIPRSSIKIQSPNQPSISQPKQDNKPNAMRKTFTITKNSNMNIPVRSPSRGSAMMNTTTSGFRPPTGLRRCSDEDHSNYLNRYEIVKELGKGTFGVVLLGKERKKQKKNQIKQEDLSLLNPQQTSTITINTLELPSSFTEAAKEEEEKTLKNQQEKEEKLYAIKVYEKFKMNKDPAKFKNIRKEINLMQNISHENIVKLYESVDTLTKISLVVEYGGSQSLLDYLKKKYPLTGSEIRNILQQLLSAVQYLHQRNIVHRDIKLQNILVNDEKIKLIDFGFSTLTYQNRKLNAICGTPNYMAPELLSKKQYFGEETDVWSIGIVAYTVGQGKHPFKAQTYNELERLANKCKYDFKRIQNPNYQNFIRRMLRVKGNQRARVAQLLSHPWLTQTQ